MKKLLSVLLSVFMLASLVACTQQGGNDVQPQGTTTTVKVGTGSVTSVKASSVSADSEKGTYQVDTTYAVVGVDAEGKIFAVKFDVAQNKGTVDGTGAVTVGEEFPTKYEKKEAYNMKSASPIGKEWYEQIEAFEAWCVGKTLDEVLAVEVNPEAHNAPKVDELTSSCTMGVVDFINALAKAKENLKEVTVSGDVKVGVASVTGASVASATADNAAKVQFDTTIAAVALDAEGKLVYVDLDVAQNKASYDATGVTTLDAASADTRTKAEKKEDYNMKSASPISKEWYEQADAFEAWCVGKTVTEVGAVEVDPEAHNAPKVDELTSSCTMNVVDFISAIVKACE